MVERLVGRANRRGILGEVMRVLANEGLLSAARPMLQDTEKRLLRLPGSAQRLGEALVTLGRKAGGDRERGELRLTAEVRELPEWKRVDSELAELKADLEEIGKLSTRLKDAAPNFSSENLMLDRELSGSLSSLAEVAQLFGELLEGPKASRCHAAMVKGNGDWALSSQPVDVSPFFRDDFSMRPRALVLTSATLSTSPEKPWILERLGLDEEHPKGAPKYVRSATPFDLKRQALVVLVTDAPDPQSEEFIEWASTRISGLAQFMGGRVLGLFASARRLEEIGERVRGRLEPLGIEVLQQSRGNSRLLAARQEEDLGSVLLGTKSFWQGVDIPGRGVACVFIDKLPIEPHNRPIVSAREEQLGAAASNNHFAGFNQYRLPRALIQLRQGVGRLIRSARDRGVVVIADPGSPRYRDQVLAALDGYRVEALPWAKARLRIHDALLAMELKAPPARNAVRAPQAAELAGDAVASSGTQVSAKG
jgi:ATP-dependent DNA helicase DinG